MADHMVLILRPSRGERTWSRVEPDRDGRNAAFAELVRQAMLIDSDRGTELLQAILDCGYSLDEPIYMDTATADAWLCIMRNEAGAVEPPIPQMGAWPAASTDLARVPQ